MRMLQSTVARLSRGLDWAMRLCRYGALCLIAVMTAVILLQVFCRYVLNSPLSWPEEAARYMMVWMTFLVVPVAYREGLIVRMETLVDRLPTRPRQVLELALHLCIVATAATLFFESIWMVERGSLMTSSALGVGMQYVFSVLPLSFALVCIVGLEQMMAITSKLFSPESDDPELSESSLKQAAPN